MTKRFLAGTLLLAAMAACGVKPATLPTTSPVPAAPPPAAGRLPVPVVAPTATPPGPAPSPVRSPELPYRLFWRPELRVYRAEVEAVDAAARRWNGVLGAPVFDFEPGPGRPVELRLMPLDPEHPTRAGLACRSARCGGWSVAIVLTARELPLYPIALHELGHILGLSHSASRDDVMFPTLGAAELSAVDIARARLSVAGKAP